MAVLVIGHRRGITRSLEKRGLPFVVWHPEPIRSRPKALRLIEKPVPENPEELLSELRGLRVDVVIAGTEGAVFPASRARAILGARRNPHSAIVRCFDKLSMKKHLSGCGIPMTPFLDARKARNPEAVFGRLGRPVVVKERRGSGGRGMEMISSPRELRSRLTGGKILEARIRGSEGSVESLIHGKKILFANATRYAEPGRCNLVPGGFSESEAARIRMLNERVVKALNIRWGMTHLEFYLLEKGILFGEIALRPPGGYIMDAMGLAYGKDFWDLFVAVELGEAPDLSGLSARFAASVILHPGAGPVESVRGVKRVRALASLVRLEVKVKAGDIVPERRGVGEGVGHALLRADTRNELSRDLRRFDENFRIVLKKQS